jgi:hypothetical protein
MAANAPFLITSSREIVRQDCSRAVVITAARNLKPIQRALTGRAPGLGTIAFAFRQLRCALRGIRRLALLGLDALAA